VKFPVLASSAAERTASYTPIAGASVSYTTGGADKFSGASVVIWTTTPWTIPANRAISFSNRIGYGLYEITEAPAENWAKVGDKLIIADKLVGEVFAKAKVTGFEKRAAVTADELLSITAAHPLRGFGGGYEFGVPLLDGEHVTDDAGTGFVHTAPGHGLDDFGIWMESTRLLQDRGIDPAIPYVVGDDGFYTSEAPGFDGARVIDDNGQ
jgi:isoleucyl-tRNA synthetase